MKKDTIIENHNRQQRSQEIQQIIVNNIINQLSLQFQVPKSIIYHALLIFSGDVALATDYLQKGVKCGVKGWTNEEDDNLISNPSPEMFEGREEEHIRRRIAFLDEIKLNN